MRAAGAGVASCRRAADLGPKEDRVENAQRDGNQPRRDERHPPAAVIDEIARNERGAAHAKVAPDAIERNAHAGILPPPCHDGEADGMIDCRKNTEHEQGGPDFHRRAGECGQNGRQPDANEEHRDHALAAPFIGKPSRRQ